MHHLMARVAIVEDNAFHRDLMSDVVTCNDMRVVELDESTWWGPNSTAARVRPCDVLVVDLDLPNDRGLKIAERAASMPASIRPRVVGVRAASGPSPRRRNGTDLPLEELLQGPLDVGGFARCVQRQAQDLRLGK